MPALQELFIEGALPTYDSSIHSLYPPSDARKVLLLNVKHLRLGGRMLDVALTLSHLEALMMNTLGLAVIPDDDDEQLEMEQFFRVVCDHMVQAGQYLPVEEIHISNDAEFYLSASPDSSQYGDVYFEFGHSDVDKPAIVHHFLETLPFCPILRAEISGMEFYMTDWFEAFGDSDGNASSISCLSIKGRLLDEFCYFFADSDPELDTPPAELELPLQGLESLEIQGHCFRPLYVRHLLLETLQTRKEQGISVEWLKFTRCLSLDFGWLDELKDIVPEVKVERRS
ncbi:hypothetical protein EWM64_g5863 [Hericium alpestre]|uniref:Uncharacterized protein n=1 Tax=Hericium alpestre TaxID=135208 RepID=A0A4Y9ZXB4_9AGAM|nr:hypothetical protein EWM64_g5863 [Hericium alpestre]